MIKYLRATHASNGYKAAKSVKQQTTLNNDLAHFGALFISITLAPASTFAS